MNQMQRQPLKNRPLIYNRNIQYVAGTNMFLSAQSSLQHWTVVLQHNIRPNCKSQSHMAKLNKLIQSTNEPTNMKTTDIYHRYKNTSF